MSSGAIAVPRIEQTGRVTQARVAHSEWTKLRSLRSSRWSLLVAVVLTVGLPLLIATILSWRWGRLSPRNEPTTTAIASPSPSPASTSPSSRSRFSACC